jgi:hypothetical protein
VIARELPDPRSVLRRQLDARAAARLRVLLLHGFELAHARRLAQVCPSSAQP